MRRLPRILRASVVNKSSIQRQPLLLAAPRPIATRPFTTTRWARATDGKEEMESRRAADQQKKDEIAEFERDHEAALKLQGEYGVESEEDEVERVVRESRIVIPPSMTVAPFGGNGGNYVPAESGDKLRRLGGLKGWWDQDGHWNDVDLLDVFANEETKDDKVREVLLRQAIVECLAVLGKQGEGMLTAAWEAGLASVRKAADIDVVVGSDGDVTLSGDLEGMLQGLAPQQASDAHGEESSTSDTALEAEDDRANFLPPDEAQQILLREGTDAPWKNVSLANPKFKFAVHKRFYQLSGSYMPDAKLAGVETAEQLLQLALKPPKPKRLVDEIEQRDELLNLPNVMVFNRRVTPIDKEIWQGRWKVIEDELRERDLPVTGRGKWDKAAEPRWYSGEQHKGRRRPNV